jgi:DinB superfamily
MNESERIAAQYEKALRGDGWYGQSWRELLEGLSPESALARPVGPAHSIAEIAAHAATWHDVVRRRLEGETPQVADDQDWPPVTGLAPGDWEAATRRLLDTGGALVETIRRFPPERLHEPRPGLTDSWYDLMMGELEHVLYHLGQVGLLRKGVAAAGH